MRKLTGIAILTLLACAATVAPVGGPAAAQGQNIAADWPQLMFPPNVLGPFFFPRNFDDNSEESREEEEVLVNYDQATTSLVAGNRRSFTIQRNKLKRNARGSSACCRAISLKNRKLAVTLLGRLPRRFVRNVAVVDNNGIVAVDPDSRIRHQLRRTGPPGNIAGSGGEGAR